MYNKSSRADFIDDQRNSTQQSSLYTFILFPRIKCELRTGFLKCAASRKCASNRDEYVRAYVSLRTCVGSVYTTVGAVTAGARPYNDRLAETKHPGAGAPGPLHRLAVNCPESHI